MSYALALGEACPPCYTPSGGQCTLCPDGADDFPECAGCVNGQRDTIASAVQESLITPVIAGVATMLLVTYLSSKLLKKS